MFEEKKRQSIYCNTPTDNACYNPLGKWQSVLAKLVIVNDYNDTVIAWSTTTLTLLAL